MERAKDHSVPGCDPQSLWRLASQNVDLMSQGDVLKLERRARFEARDKKGEGGGEDVLHP